jgi:hypothetical protein
MSDTNEERLLSDLLRAIARDDAALEASGELEGRVMAAWSARGVQPPGAADHPWAAWTGALVFGAAALATAVLVLAVAGVRQRSPTAHGPRIDTARQAPSTAIETLPQTHASREAARPPRAPVATRATPRRLPADPLNEIVRFVPLVPMTAAELSGPFSIARVQIGRTEADVLLGEDGMARAIRLSANESASWRSR